MYKTYAFILIIILLIAVNIMGLQAFGWVYSIAFALSAAPQALKSLKDGHSEGIASGTLFLWGVGEFGGIIYGFSLMQWPIIFNCVINTLFLGIIMWYRFFPRKEQYVID